MSIRAIRATLEDLGCKIESDWVDDTKKVEIHISLPSSDRYEHAFLHLDNGSMDGKLRAELELYAFMDFNLSDPQMFEKLKRLVVDRLR